MPPRHIRLEEVRRHLARRTPAAIEARTHSQAAVAILLAEHGGDTSALLIQRAERPDDPWSGHMAFPGGRRAPGEDDLYATAARETFEEVGVDIGRHGSPLGRLDDIRAQSDRPLDMLIRPYVCGVTSNVVVRPNASEVQATVWVPLSALVSPDSATVHRVSAGSAEIPFPAFRYRGFTIWGLTYRMLRTLLEALPDTPRGRPLPPPAPEE
jgi:8-oxo-dGTP pyrophosphatase MutT (NUDIX family)